MELKLKNNFGDIGMDCVKEAFIKEGFDIVSPSAAKQTFVVAYKGLYMTVSRHVSNILVNGNVVTSVKLSPNKRFASVRLVEENGSCYSIVTIDFENLKRELDFAAKAKTEREGDKKALKFQIPFYKLYLQAYFEELGLKPDSYSLNMNQCTDKCVSFDFHYNDRMGTPFSHITLDFMVPVQSKKNMDLFFKSDFENIVASKISWSTFGKEYQFNHVNIIKFMDAVAKPIIVSAVKDSEDMLEYLERLKPYKEKMEETIRQAKATFALEDSSITPKFRLTRQSILDKVSEEYNKFRAKEVSYE